MPRLELIDVPLYQPTDPYIWEVDNAPLRSLMQRDKIINLAVDNIIRQMADAVGTQGTVSNRLNQSINPDGTLKMSAVDATNHSIEAHTDGGMDSNGIAYVRMKQSESAKLALVDDLATNLYAQVVPGTMVNPGAIVEFRHGPLQFVPSSTVTVSINEPNQIQFNMTFPAEAAHQHFYNIEPATTDGLYKNYSVGVDASNYAENSLRVYINGFRLNPDKSQYVPGYNIHDAWTLMTYTDHGDGTFTLSTAVSPNDVVTIDYDINYIRQSFSSQSFSSGFSG